LSAPRDPVRWKDLAADRFSLENRAATLASAAADVAPLDAASLARVRGAVVASRMPANAQGGAASRRLRWALVVALVLLVSVATAGGASVLWRRYVSPGARSGPPAARAPAAALVPRGHPRPTAPPRDPQPAELPVPTPDIREEVPTPAPAGAAMIHGPSAGPRARAGEASAAGMGLPAADSSATVVPTSEAGMLARALSELRRAHLPRRALALLDRYERTFPAGVLGSEAASIRIEALIALEDWTAALSLLDREVAFAGPLAADLRLTRAELRARDGRCADAVGDFTELLSGASGRLANQVTERALYGRAVCRVRLRDEAGARADLRDYRGRFPEGRFAVDVNRLLDGGSARGGP